VSQHRWEQSVEPDEAVPLLWKAKAALQAAFRSDQLFSREYPLNVSYAFERINSDLSRLLRPKRTESAPQSRLSLAPKKLAELLPENLIEAMWEDQHNGIYRDALRQAASANSNNMKRGWKAFQGIVHAMEAAYLVRYWGIENLQTPRVNILHKGLNQIALQVGLRGLTATGFAEMLDDLCPCGLTDHRGAVRQMWRRSRSLRLSET
jgi:hypothetical protein